MKYVNWIFILFFSLLSIVFADQTISLNNKIISFDQIKNYNLQSFTIVDDNLVVILVNYDNDAGIIKLFSLKTMKEIKSVKTDKLGHANGVTYNNKTKQIYILNGSGDDTIYVYDSETLEKVKEIKVSLPIRSITYVDDLDIYLVRTFITGYKLDKDFNLINKVPFISNLNPNYDIARQDWTYYNNYLYYVTWSWKRLGGDGVNIIYVYNMKGKLIETLYTEDNIGEIEDIAFYNNKMVLGFNGYDNKVNFYLEDIIDIKEQIDEIKETKKVKEKKNYNIYMITIVILVIISFIIFRRFKKVS